MENIKEEIEIKHILENEITKDIFQKISNKINYSELCNICRICFETITDKKVSLNFVFENEMLIDMIRSFSSTEFIVPMNPEENIPSFLCETCQIDVINCYKFKKKCEYSDIVLQSILKDQTLVEHTKNLFQENVDVENNKYDCFEDNHVEYLDDIVESSTANETLIILQNVGTADEDIQKSSELIHFKENPSSSDLLTQRQHSCIFCLKKFDKLKSLRAHVTKKHSNGAFTHSCDRCKEVFSSLHDLEVHSAVHTAGPVWRCNKCNKEFEGRYQLRRHLLRHMQAKRFACECGKAFTELYALRRHARVHSGQPRDKNYACHHCDKRYSEKGQLAVHMVKHEGSRRCACTTCGKRFASARLLASHRLVHDDHKRYKCLYCDKRFRHESTRITHHRTHTGEKPYVCSTCGKTFIQNSNLTLHMRTHTGEKPYACEKCDQKFSTGSSLKSHLRRHTGEKPYVCKVCGKRFAQRDLTAHMRLHTGERPHACSVCPKKFVNASRLRDHCRIHTGEKPFECATCTKTFSTKSHLVKHLKKHEPKMKREKRDQMKKQEALVISNDKITTNVQQITSIHELQNNKETDTNETSLAITPTVPLEVTGELMVQDDCEVKEIFIVANTPNNANFHNGDLCLNSAGINYVNSDVNLVTVNEGTTVKLYQLDQSVVQIHSAGGQVTISKITSKTTANF